MSTFVNDTFTDTALTTLASHTGETGATWTQNTHAPDGGAGEIIINAAGTAVRQNVMAQETVYYPSGSPASADYSVQASFTLITDEGDDAAGIWCRLSSSAYTGYFAYWSDSGTDSLKLFKFVAGSGSQLGSTYTAAATTNSVVLECIGSASTVVTVYVDGVARITATDSSSPITAAGHPGIYLFTNNTINSLHAWRFDSFSAYDGAAFPTTSAAPLMPRGPQFARRYGV